MLFNVLAPSRFGSGWVLQVSVTACEFVIVEWISIVGICSIILHFNYIPYIVATTFASVLAVFGRIVSGTYRSSFAVGLNVCISGTIHSWHVHMPESIPDGESQWGEVQSWQLTDSDFYESKYAIPYFSTHHGCTWNLLTIMSVQSEGIFRPELLTVSK